MKAKLYLLSLVALTGCASGPYRDTQIGEFKGDLEVRWVKNDYFVFSPSKDKPFKFIRPNGEIIEPGKMYTDGGSIPRMLWGVKGLSPWGYAPAYIIHDWLFDEKHCNSGASIKYTFDDSAVILAEGLKSVMERDDKVKNHFVFDAIVSAVKSPIAQKLWEKGKCNRPDADALIESSDAGEFITTLHF